MGTKGTFKGKDLYLSLFFNSIHLIYKSHSMLNDTTDVFISKLYSVYYVNDLLNLVFLDRDLLHFCPPFFISSPSTKLSQRFVFSKQR